MTTNLQKSGMELIFLIFAVTLTTANRDRCMTASDCPADAKCERDYCECRYGGSIYDGRGNIEQCRSFASEYPAVIPSVVAVVLLLLIAGAGVGIWFYLRRKKRLRQPRTPTAWVVDTPFRSDSIGQAPHSSNSKPNRQYQSIPMDPPAHMS